MYCVLIVVLKSFFPPFFPECFSVIYFVLFCCFVEGVQAGLWHPPFKAVLPSPHGSHAVLGSGNNLIVFTTATTPAVKMGARPKTSKQQKAPEKAGKEAISLAKALSAPLVEERFVCDNFSIFFFFFL